MRKKLLSFAFINIFILSMTFGTKCYGDTTSDKKDINTAANAKNYEVVIPQVLELDSRTALTRNEINVIDKKVFENLSRYKKLLTKYFDTTGLKYDEKWTSKLQEIAKEIKKQPNTIIILEGFRNTELKESENIALSREHASFFASVLKDVYGINNTMAVIGKGLEKNENFIYNCVIISLIKDIDPSQSIQ